MDLSDRRLRWWSPSSWSRGDWIALALLVVVPVALFVLPALFGHPAIDGDNLLQNYPLRVLSGRQLAAGHLPEWNPYVDSGAPLLGGLNAGSMYPGTWLFAFLPGLVAWVLNLLVVYWAAGIGVFVLARWLRVSALAAGLAALTYAYSGAMIGQLVHLGVIQGQAWLPWLVLSQLALARAVLSLERGTPLLVGARRALPGVLAIAFVIGMICLTGEPRSITDAEMVALVVLCCELVVHGGVATATVVGRVAYVVASAVGATWGAALSLVQLLPGQRFISISERSKITYAFFGAGSIGWRWLSLLFSQGLLGDNGIFGTSRFFGSYNLPEVTGYVGLLALTAVFAFGVQLCRRTSPAPRRRFVAFFALFIVGVVLTLGNTTPLGPVLHAFPLLGQTRLQSRNLAIVDLGATLLLAWWVDALVARRLDEASLTGRRTIVTLVPLGVTVATCTAALVNPGAVTQVLLASPHSAVVAQGIRLAVAVSLVLALGYLVVLVAGSRRGAVAIRALLVVAIIDLLAFNVFYESALVTGLPSPFPNATLAHAMLGNGGRTAIVDSPLSAYHEIVPLGAANTNVFTGLQSVQGYGSLIAARYNAATGTQYLATLGGCDLAHGRLAPLRLTAIAVSAASLIDSRGVHHAPPGCSPPGWPTTSRRYFGVVGAVTSLRFTNVGGRAFGPNVTVALLNRHGAVLRVPEVRASGSALSVRFPTAPLAAGVVLVDPRGTRLADTVLRRANGTVVHLDVPMQVGLDAPGWQLVDVVRNISFFRFDRPASLPSLWLTPRTAAASTKVVSASNNGSLTVRVSSPIPTTLVRSETWLPGWQATITRPNGTDAHDVAVRPRGVVQSVALPSGRWLVSFSYDAPGLRTGLLASTGAVVAFVLGLGWLVATRRRRHRRGELVAADDSADGGARSTSTHAAADTVQ